MWVIPEGKGTCGSFQRSFNGSSAQARGGFSSVWVVWASGRFVRSAHHLGDGFGFHLAALREKPGRKDEGKYKTKVSESKQVVSKGQVLGPSW